MLVLTNINSYVNFSYLLQKHPQKQQCKPDRKGYLIGYFHGNDYCVEFQDDDDEVSYPEYAGQEFEYLAKGKFCHPFLYHKIVSLYFKLDKSFDIQSNWACQISSIVCRPKTLELFQNFFPEVKFDVTKSPTDETLISLSILSSSTLDEFVTFLKVFLFYCYIDVTKDFINTDQIVQKFEELVKVDAPYFVRYLYKTNLLRNSGNRFSNVEAIINQSSKYQLKFTPYNNLECRVRFIRDNVKDGNVVDIGCGEGRYIKILHKQNLNYTCVDRDKDALEKSKAKAKRFGLEEKIQFVDNLDLVPDTEESNIIFLLTEVIEHSNPGESLELVQRLTRYKGIKKIVITTPNIKFNNNYCIKSLRNPDHKFEFTEDEFRAFLDECIKENSMLTYEVFSIGDVVDGEATTFGAIIQ